MTHELLARLGLDTQDFNEGIESASNSTSRLGAMGNMALTGLSLAAGAVGVSVLGIGATVWEVGSEIDAASRQMAASLGLTLEESENLQESMVEVWGEGLNASIEETGSAITIVSQQMKSLAEDDIADATKSALKLQSVFEDADLERSTNAANVLMNMGVEADKAFDIIAKGYQEGLSSSGDWLDSISEYGNLFNEAGFSAEQMFSLMQSGLQGGVLGTDKISDAIKEFGIIMNEGGEEASAAFSNIGLSYEDIKASIVSGDKTWGDYFDQIVSGINSIEDPFLRSQTQVALFGTAAEDLGTSFTQGLSASSTSLEDFAGSMDALNVRYENFGDMAERFKRRFLIALLPVRDSLLELANQAMPYVEQAFNWFGTTLPPILGAANQAIAMIGQGDFAGLSNLWTDAGPKIEMFATQLYAWIDAQATAIHARFLTWKQAALSWLVESSPQLMQNAETLALAFGNWIVSKAVDLGISYLTWKQATLNWMISIAPDVLLKAEELAISLLSWISLKGNEIFVAFTPWALSFVSWIDEAAPLLLFKTEEIGMNYLAWINAKAVELSIAFQAWSTPLSSWADDGSVILSTKLELIGVSFIGWISIKANEILIAFQAWGQSLVAWIGPAAISFLAEWPFVLFNFLTWIEQAAGPILLQLGDWALSFSEWIVPMIPTMLIALASIELAIGAFIVETAVVIGIKLVDWAIAFVGWIASEAVPRLWVALQAMEDAFFEWVNWGAGWLLEQGGILGASLVDGILNMLRGTGASIGNLLNDAIQAGINQVKATFGIQSPSRVLADEVGVPLIEGVAQGIFKSGWMVQDSLNSVTDISFDTLISEASALGLSFDGSSSSFREFIDEIYRINDEATFAEWGTREWINALQDLTEEIDLMDGVSLWNLFEGMEAAPSTDEALRKMKELGFEFQETIASSKELGELLSSQSTISSNSLSPEVAISFSETASTEAFNEINTYLFEWLEEEKVWLAEEGNQLGNALLDGIIVILENGGGVIAQFLTQSIEYAISQVKATYGIASPSRVFADEIGTPLADGIAVGVSGQRQIIANAVVASVDYGKSKVSFANNQKVNQIRNNSQTTQSNTINVQVTASAGNEYVAANVMRSELDSLMRARARGFNA